MPQIVARGCVVAYEVAGKGTPVILLHGGGSSGRQWRSLVAALSKAPRLLRASAISGR